MPPTTSLPGSATESDRPRGIVPLTVALVVLVWVSRWHFPEPSAAPILDPSFLQALGYALVHRLQFGTDIVFTYGPLGWFNASPHQPELFAWKCYGFEFVFALMLALFFGATALRLRSRLAVVLFAILLSVPDIGFDAYSFLAILALSQWAIVRAPRSTFVLVLPLIALVVLALGKFTYTMLGFVAVIVIAIAAARGGRGRALVVVAIFAGIFVGAWAALGQSAANIPRWLRTSAELSSAFSSAQSIASTPGLIALAIGVCVLGLATVLLAVRGALDRPRATLLATLWIASLFLAFKAGFTRATGNEITFFGCAGAAPFLLFEPDRGLKARRLFTWTRGAMAIAGLVGFCCALGEHGTGPLEVARIFGRDLATNVRTATSLNDFRAMRDQERLDLARKYALPHVKAAVGDATIDVFGTEQGIVFANDLAWHPRPVFQAYSVFTDALSLENARFMQSASAPRFVLYRSGAIDSRLATIEDAHTLQVILRDYEAVLGERGFVLFERRADAPRISSETVVLEREMMLGEMLDLTAVEGRVLIVEATVRSSMLGRAQAFFSSAAVLEVELEADDGTRETARIIPEMIAGGAIVRPWLAHEDDWTHWLAHDSVHRIVRMRFVGASSRFAQPISVRVRRADDLEPTTKPERVPRILWPMFDPPPTHVELSAPATRTTQRGFRDLLVLQAPSLLGWSPASGRYQLRAQFGFLPDAWHGGETDGAIVRVERRSRAGERVQLFERMLDPKRRREDTSMQELDLAFEMSDGDEIALVVDPGQSGNAERDWIYWTNVTLTAAK